MTTLPKPTRRAVKPRHPIARTSTPRKFRQGGRAAKLRKANQLWVLWIRSLAPDGICVRCRKRPFHDACHLFTKGAYPNVRFDKDNGLPCCRPCHQRIDSDHEAKLELAMRCLGAGKYRELQLRAVGRGKADLDLTILYLRQLLAGSGV